MKALIIITYVTFGYVLNFPNEISTVPIDGTTNVIGQIVGNKVKNYIFLCVILSSNFFIYIFLNSYYNFIK